MRVGRFLVAAAFAVLTTHCASEEPKTEEAQVTENVPGDLVITSPTRAAFIEGEVGKTVEVKGTGATPDLTINGQKAEVAPDGSFHAKIKPAGGLNIIVAVDGESRLETPFLYGKFAPMTEPVAQAVALDIGAQGISGAPPAASITSVANQFLESKNFAEMVEGMEQKGSVAGQSYTVTVTRARYEGITVGLAPRNGGLHANVTVRGVAVDAKVTAKILFATVNATLKATATNATARGDADISLDEETGTVGAAMPSAEVKLDGFRIDVKGLPSVLDTIPTNVFRPMIERGLADFIKNELPKAVALTLEGLGLPKQLDLSAVGVQKPIPIATKFDGLEFDNGGATVTASVLFGQPFKKEQPGGKAPGWLKLGGPLGDTERASSLGVSVSLDSVNQLLFAAWGSGDLTVPVPDVLTLTDIKLTPKLPPVVAATDKGAVRVALGEVLIEANLAGKPFKAAVSVMQDVDPDMNGKELVLTPKGEPTLSITWLEADNIVDAMRNIVTTGAKEQMGKLLKPFKFPFPTIALDALGGPFAGQSLALGMPEIDVDPKAARLSLSGAMALVR